MAKIPSTEDLARSAAEMTPILAARGGEGDRNKRTADDLIEQIAERGLFNVTKPADLGGYGYTGAASCAVTEHIARGDGSVSWIVMNLHAGIWNAGAMKAAARDDVWGSEPGARVCSVTTPRGQARKVPGGWRMNGAWPFASGCLHSSWTTLAAQLVDGDGNPIGIGIALAPMRELEITGDWDVGGFRGTGSLTLMLNDVFVPDHRMENLVSMIEGAPAYERPDEDPTYYNIGLSVLFSSVVFGPIVGLGEAAYDAFTEGVIGREVAYSMAQQADSQIVQLHVARMRMAIESARLMGKERMRIAETAAAQGQLAPLEERAKLRAALSYTARQILEEAQLLMADSGGRGLAEAGRLPRVLRDLQALNNHGIVNPFQTLESWGATLLGRQPKISLL